MTEKDAERYGNQHLKVENGVPWAAIGHRFLRARGELSDALRLSFYPATQAQRQQDKDTGVVAGTDGASANLSGAVEEEPRHRLGPLDDGRPRPVSVEAS